MEQHRLNKEFDRVVTINLANRTDKREQMQLRLDKLGIKTEWYTAVEFGFAPQIVPTLIKAKVAHFNDGFPNEAGAFCSHYSVIKTAYIQDVQRLFVFEDDVLFHKDFNNLFNKYMDVVPENWDMLMLYSFMFKILPENIRINARWIKSYKSWSHMAFSMSRNMMKGYIERMDKMPMMADHQSFLMQEQGFKVYSAVPTLCIPNAKLGSNIRQQMNYVQTNTAINLGINNDIYE